MPDFADPDLVLPDIELSDLGLGRAEEESPFARDEDDILIRREAATREHFNVFYRVSIDGYVLERVPKAVPMTDSAGNFILDADGKPKPRETTIYDAAKLLERDDRWSKDENELQQRLPVLCHQPHLNPVGVCRMCSVHISKLKKGEFKAERKLFPACHHPVEDGMVVVTRRGDKFDPVRAALADLAGKLPPTDGLTGDDLEAAKLVAAEAEKAKSEKEAAKRNAETVKKSTGMLTQFLLTDHRREALAPAGDGDPYNDGRYVNELTGVAKALGVDPRPGLPRPTGSRNDRSGDGRSRRVGLKVLTPSIHELADDEQARDDWVAWNQRIDDALPYSSRTVVVDHDRCIMCDRCARACNDVRKFNVIGHTGKGYTARISFDFDKLMSESSCVQCGECMISCPTGALSLRRRVQPRNWDDSLEKIPVNPNTPFPESDEFLTADEMLEVRLKYRSRGAKGVRDVFPFRSIPFAYLKWNEGSVRRHTIPASQSKRLCVEGEYGSTAFLLEGTGTVHFSKKKAADAKPSGLFGRLFPARQASSAPGRLGIVAGDTLITGEMACLSHKPRNATVDAVADPDEPMVVYEVTRNILDMMQRAEAIRDDLREVYTVKSIEDVLERGKLLEDLPNDYRREVVDFLLRYLPDSRDGAVRAGEPPRTYSEFQLDTEDDALQRHPALSAIPDPDRRKKVIDYLRAAKEYEAAKEAAKKEAGGAGEGPPVEPVPNDRLELLRLDPGELVVAEGKTGADFYLIRLGFLRLYRTFGGPGGRQEVLAVLSDNEYFGEVALLADELERRKRIPAGGNIRKRFATIEAIDPSEVVRIPGELFKRMCDRFPEVRERLLVRAEELFQPPGDDKKAAAEARKANTPAFDALGVYMGQKMLALDLVSCTRCDECTRACADSHPGRDGFPSAARLLREGMRFGDFLIATSCRSCHKPYCMDGCPVDAIHRKGTGLAVKIEDHCIGCGLCERNCPYGAIQMIDRTGGAAGPRTATTVRRAVNCDLCESVGGQPFCVSACPHDAAFRFDGKTLLAEVTERAARAGN